MQDKELDNLFRSKLDDFETEPSANVWRGIDEGLDTAKRRKITVPLLSAAASIIVLVSAGILLIPHYTRHAAHRPGSHSMVRINTPVKTQAAVPVNNAGHVAVVATAIKTDPARQAAAIKPVVKQPVAQPQTSNTPAVQQQVSQPVQQVIAAVPDKRDPLIQPTQNDSTLLAANTIAQLNVKPIQAVMPDKPVLAQATAQPPAKKRRIHSLGDMLNTVIAAVDKRRDKLIEFTDTDDDESVVTGVNLGILAVKKQN